MQNLLGKLSGFFNERMIDSGLLKTLNNMRERKWADEDIAKDIQAVRDVLIREYKELKYGFYSSRVYPRSIETNIDLFACFSAMLRVQYHGALREGAKNGNTELGTPAH